MRKVNPSGLQVTISNIGSPRNSMKSSLASNAAVNLKFNSALGNYMPMTTKGTIGSRAVASRNRLHMKARIRQVRNKS